jgi:hypothetical protein
MAATTKKAKAAPVPTLLDNLESIQSLVAEGVVEGKRFVEKGNKSAAARMRKNFQAVKNLVPVIRKQTLESGE